MKKLLSMILAVLLLAALGASALADYGAVAARSTKLYMESNLKGEVGKLSKYTSVLVRSVSSGIARISHEGKTYYVSNKNLTLPWNDLEARLSAQGIETTWDCNRYTKRSCYVYNYPSKSAAKKRVKKNVVVWACYAKNGWTLVECNGYYGYIRTSNLGVKSM